MSFGLRRFREAALALVWCCAASGVLGQDVKLAAAGVSAQNHTLKLAVTAARIQGRYGDESAPEGRKFLVLQTTWQNVIDAGLAEKRSLPLRALNDNLHETLSVLLDGKEVVFAETRASDTRNLNPEDKDVVGTAGGSTGAAYIRPVVGIKNDRGARTLAYIELAKPGDTVTGETLFSIPADPLKNAELVYSDPLGGKLRLQLTGKPVAELAPARAQTNEVLALAATLIDGAAATANLAAPPPGRRWVAVDLAGKSLLKVKDNVPPYDPAHEPGEEYWRPDPAGWIEFHDNVQLIADGTLPCAMDPASGCPAEAEFSPELWKTYRLLYLAPADAKSLQLLCYFPAYTVPGVEGDVQPKVMRFTLAGAPTAYPAAPAKAEVKIVDGPVEFYVARHHVATRYADAEAGDDERFLIVECQLRNAGKDGEEFKYRDQLVWFTDGGETPPDEASVRGVYAPPEYFHLEPGAAFAFHVAWKVPAKITAFQLGLKGNTKAEKFTLK